MPSGKYRPEKAQLADLILARERDVQGQMQRQGYIDDHRSWDRIEDWIDATLDRYAARPDTPPAPGGPCPRCGTRHAITARRRWPWRRQQTWRCYGCFAVIDPSKHTPATPPADTNGTT